MEVRKEWGRMIREDKMRGERMIRETQGKEKRERLGQVGGERERKNKRKK